VSLTILSVAYPFAPVQPDAVGGAEQVLATLEAGLVAAGCRSLVLACPGSRAAGELHNAPPIPATIDDQTRRQVWDVQRETIARLVSEHQVDLVHMHGVDCVNYLPPPTVPTLVTLHLPLAWYPRDLLALADRNVHFACVSDRQRDLGGPAFEGVPVVENGVPLWPADPTWRKRAYALALGRICPEKGFHDAVVAAQWAGVSLGIAGRVFPYAAHEAYFRDALAPHLDRKRRFLGPISGRAKRRLVASARCLVIPSLVEETSSLVAMEAMAAGTPVIARRIGALVDIVEHGKTGYLVDDVAGMGEAIAQADHLDAEVCRETARARFAASGMVQRYLDLYRSVLAGEPRWARLLTAGHRV
jgi:glycosyltransferase involved in cell wall biosynthesis